MSKSKRSMMVRPMDFPIRSCFRRRSTFKYMEKYGGAGLMFDKIKKKRSSSCMEKRSVKHTENATFHMMKHLRENMDDEHSVLNDMAAIVESITLSTGRMLYVSIPGEDEIYLYRREGSRIGHKIGPGSILAAYTAYTRKLSLSRSSETDNRFPLGTGLSGKKEMDYPIMSIPVLTPEEELLAVVEVFRDCTEEQYDKDDELIAVCVTNWLGAAILKHRNTVRLVNLKNLNDEFITIMTPFFVKSSKTLSNMVELIYKMSFVAKKRLNAEKVTFYRMMYVDKFIADIYEDTENGEGKWPKRMQLREKEHLIKLAINTNEIQNLNNQELKKFPEVEEGIRSVLCMPVQCSAHNIGILALFNKIGDNFTKNDEKTLEYLREYFAMILHYYAGHMRSEESRRKLRDTKELLAHQLEPCPHELQWASDMWENHHHQLPIDFYLFDYYPKNKTRERLIELSLLVLKNSLGSQFMEKNDVIKFALMVSQGYRDNFYHNFEHAFIVTHCMMNFLKRNHSTFCQLEEVGLIIAAFCHDIDHPGFTNSFLKATSNDLVQLYQDSVLENHHSFMANLLIKHCKLFSYLDAEEYKTVMNDIHELIISTDLSVYFSTLATITNLKAANNFSMQNRENKKLIKGILMTACDLSGSCKPFRTSRGLLNLLYHEFHNQGEEEKKRGLDPIDMMDRSKTYLQPVNQCTFLSLVCIPCLDMLQNYLPCAEILVNNCKELLKHWSEEQRRITSLYGF